MITATWASNKSLMMQEARVQLKKKPEKGQASIPRREANRTWREDILGILSDNQKKERKQKRQEKSARSKSNQQEE